VETITVTSGALGLFAASILRRCGADKTEARVVADILVWCDLMGRRNYGVQRLPILAKRLSLGLMNSPCEMRVVRKAPSVELIDADRGIGHYVGEFAMRRAIALALDAGVGFVGVRNSNFYGAGAYFVQCAAEQNMVGLALSNSFAKVAAYGGRRPVLGTNPFAFSAPRCNGRSLLLDMATSAGAGSAIRQYIEEGKPLPEGIAVDPEGRPITDPNLVERGTILPFGRARGYGISLLVEILSAVITGAGISKEVGSMYKNFEQSGDNGHMFAAINIETFMPLATYYDRMETLISFLEASGDEVMLPGEGRWRALDRTRREGLRLDVHVSRALEELSRQHDIPPPWQDA